MLFKVLILRIYIKKLIFKGIKILKIKNIQVILGKRKNKVKKIIV